MPVWQPEPAWLLEAVSSALGQLGCALELIVVDDGNDVSVEQALSGISDPRLRHVRIPHGGVSQARNAGTAVAAGVFVRYVDADDVSEPDSTQRLLHLARQGAISYEDTLVCDEQLRPQRRITSDLSGDIAVECLLGRFDARHVSMLFPRAVVEAAGLWNTRLTVREDFDFVLRCLERAPVVPGTGVATYYRRHAASATRSRTAVQEAQQATRAIVQGFFARHPELRGTSVHRQARAAMHSAEGTTALAASRPVAALGSAAMLLPVSPTAAGHLTVGAGRCAARLSRAAIARTTARGPATPPRRGR
jgi:hypothetical protein